VTVTSSHKKQDTTINGNFDLNKFIDDYREYIETVVKNETPEESKAALIRSGVMDENGNMIRIGEGIWGQ